MSSEDDSEWEREQIARGTQSRRQVNHEKLARSSGVIDVTTARKKIYDDMEKIQSNIENIKWRMGSTRLELVKSEKHVESIKNHIKNLESSNPFFEQIATIEDGQKILNFLDRNKSVISNLPHDQKELISNLAEKAKEISQPIEVDDGKILD